MFQAEKLEHPSEVRSSSAIRVDRILSVIANNPMLSTTSEGRHCLKHFEQCIQEADRAAYSCALSKLPEEA